MLNSLQNFSQVGAKRHIHDTVAYNGDTKLSTAWHLSDTASVALHLNDETGISTDSQPDVALVDVQVLSSNSIAER